MTTKPAPKADTKPKTAKTPAKKSDVSGEAHSAKPEAKKAPSTHGKVKVTQMIGTIARRWDQQATLVGLGLGKRHRSRVLQDTPEIRGMIYKVRHLVKVEY